jgi:hypothetical protein
MTNQLNELNIENFFDEDVKKLEFRKIEERLKLIKEQESKISIYLSSRIDIDGDTLDGTYLWYEYKKLLAGVLLSVQEKVFEYLKKLDENDCNDEDFKIIALFLIHTLNVVIDKDFDEFPLSDKKAYLQEKLNRPIRVCGMVKNEGQPGGGPFWVKDDEGNISLQIVEFAQINFSNKDQQGIVYKATHFNPTDLVCGVRNYKGEKFNLKDYVDYDAAFISMKTQNGTDIKALELPGLWNGSMADWISVFVEVPLKTFNPVKTVNDLLKPAHQVE